jgi:hypothetical protein
MSSISVSHNLLGEGPVGFAGRLLTFTTFVGCVFTGACLMGGGKSFRSLRIVPSSTPNSLAKARFDLPAWIPSATNFRRSMRESFPWFFESWLNASSDTGSAVALLCHQS